MSRKHRKRYGRYDILVVQPTQIADKDTLTLEEFAERLEQLRDNLDEMGLPATAEHEGFSYPVTAVRWAYAEAKKLGIWQGKRLPAVFFSVDGARRKLDELRECVSIPQAGGHGGATGLLPLVCVGERNYQLGETVVVVEDSEETILQAFFAEASRKPKWVALTCRELRRRTNLATAPRLFGKMRRKYRALASAIDCPGKKGRGGLKIYLAKRSKPR
jgi:hypothetical protein